MHCCATANTFVKFKSAGTELTPFVETRQYGLQRFLRRLVAHPALVDDALFHQFLETDDKVRVPHTTAWGHPRLSADRCPVCLCVRTCMPHTTA